ncbi:MAG: adenine phosphoribosyltransferase [Bacteroidota bacterium]
MNHSFSDRLQSIIRNVTDFPKKGIVFRDITTLLQDKNAFTSVIDTLVEQYRNIPIDAVVGIESRGFIVGAALAHRLGVGFVPIRKPGKLPAATLREEYALEYGTDAIEIHADALKKGSRVLIHDDLLATGGTVAASCRLVERLGAIVVGISFIIELTFLHGRAKLQGYQVTSLVQYDSE